MPGMSERDYAANAGISRGAVQKARKSGRLVLFADGSINAAGSDARRAQMTDPDQQRRATGGFAVATPRKPAHHKAPGSSAAPGPDGKGQPDKAPAA